ncbi:hypothetical protein B7C51_25355 (plasmid) [Paenibacillus larvae subsp. pulvifaciens]|uniref:Uncharacterized protein n=1 Tax=Paenibacillus larvae subsp. pulvifaciens TaxID=1477 RepID=A0A1V0V0X9_9BACL|nr:hypothetical protein [Paenibacillus larvae]ARF70800.1 hypothetical protein B7C51_25355 [Paenibacillus larvae subsp. pulvifaciens]
MKTRKYIDLSNEEIFEQGFEELLRNLYNRPQYRKPALGSAPTYLFEDAPSHFKTMNLLKQLNDAASRQPSRVKEISNYFFDAFFEGLEQFQIESFEPGIPYDQLIVNKINDMIVLRNDFIQFVEKQCLIQDQVYADPFIDFFEKIFGFTQPSEDVTSYNKSQWDHYKFIIQELFVYTILIFIENKQYKTANEMLNAEYFVKNPFNSELIYGNYKFFNFYLESIEVERKQRYPNRVSLTADMMIQRANLKKYPKKKMVHTDLLLYYFSIMYEKESSWFPRLYIYGRCEKVELLERLISKRHFEKVKVLFGVNTSYELIKKMEKIVGVENMGYCDSFDNIEPIDYHIDPKQICTLP